MEDSPISRLNPNQTRRADRSPASLISRCGLSSAIACAVLALSVSGALAQDKPAPQPIKEPPSPEAAELMKRVRAEAEKAGLRVEQPKPIPAAPSPGATVPTVTPTNPAPAPSPALTPAGAGQPGGAKPPTTIKAQPGMPMPMPGMKGPQPGIPGMFPGQNPGASAAPAAGLTATPADASHALNGDDFTFDFTEPVELTVLVTYVRDALGLQLIFMDGGLAGQKIYLNSPVTIKRKEVLGFITMLLEQREYTLRQDSTGIFIVEPKNSLPVASTAVSLPWSTTRIIHTPNIKPTSLQNSITSIITSGRAGQPGVQPVYMDDLGLIIMTESPRVLGLVEDMVKTLVIERAALKFHRFELRNIAAAAAKDRVLELLGQQAQRAGGINTPGAIQPGQLNIGPGGSITNLSERLSVDPTSNTIFLRGRDDERALLADLLTVVDLPNAMVSKWYPIGNKAAIAVATQGKAEQLGGVSEFDSESAGRSGSSGGGAFRQGLPGAPQGGASNDNSSAGAGFVLYPGAGGFIYRGTDAQHARVDALVLSLSVISIDEGTTYEFYKLRHGKSTDVAEIIQNLLSNTSGSGSGNRSGGLLGRDLGQRGGAGGANNRRNPAAPAGTRTGAATGRPPGTEGAASSGSSGGLGEIDGADVYVLADEPNNQILVKAPAKLQPQFRQLIGKIDLRRSQVYIDCKIIVVSETDSFRLAIEAQQIIGQFAFNTNFGLGSLTSPSTGTPPVTTGGIQSRKNVATGLGGLTSALIRSRDVPLVINALASNIDSRIVATPQLLVDDNEEAEISSLDQQPTGTTSQSGAAGSTITGFQDYQSAGPKLTVTPQISEGGYLRLEYNIELSAFQGSASGNLPPPKIENKIKSKVMVPTDATIVVGGLTFQQTGTTVVKVPLLGDIPLLGNLFKDQSKSDRISTLYVFITPKIMRDATFADLRLLTRAPLSEVGLSSEYPAPKPEAIPIVDTARYLQEQELRDEREKHKEKPEISPAKGAPVRREHPVSDEPR